MPEASLSNPQPSPKQPTSQGINWKNIIIGAVIGAVLFGGGGFLVYNAYQPKKEEPAGSETQPEQKGGFKLDLSIDEEDKPKPGPEEKPPESSPNNDVII